MSTPNKRVRKPSKNSALTSADIELIAKIVSNLEKILKMKSEEIKNERECNISESNFGIQTYSSTRWKL
jgi:hypothetical protein